MIVWKVEKHVPQLDIEVDEWSEFVGVAFSKEGAERLAMLHEAYRADEVINDYIADQEPISGVWTDGGEVCETEYSIEQIEVVE